MGFYYSGHATLDWEALCKKEYRGEMHQGRGAYDQSVVLRVERGEVIAQKNGYKSIK